MSFTYGISSLQPWYPKPVIMLEAPPEGRPAADLTSVTMIQLHDIIVKARKLPRPDINDLSRWFEFQNVSDRELPGNNFDWASKTRQAEVRSKIQDLDGRIVVFANRPWQALKASYKLTFRQIEFCRLREVRVEDERLKLRAAWIWHSSTTIEDLWQPDLTEMGLFLWNVVTDWRAEVARVETEYVTNRTFDFPSDVMKKAGATEDGRRYLEICRSQKQKNLRLHGLL